MKNKKESNHYKITNRKTIEEIKKILQQHGGFVKPSTLLEFAKNPKSPLHSLFEWDDSKAAHAFRLEQAQRILRVTVELIPVNGKDEYVRVFASLPSDQAKGKGYRLMAEVMSDADLRRELLESAMNDIDIFEKRYCKLQELSEVINVMRDFKKKNKG